MPILAPKSASICIMPLKFIFKSIFKIPKLLDETLKNGQMFLNSNTIENIASGEIFRKKVKAFPNKIVNSYELYLDDFQINNPLGNHKTPMCGSYFNFPIMPQYLLSKLEYIFTSHLKEVWL